MVPCIARDHNCWYNEYMIKVQVFQDEELAFEFECETGDDVAHYGALALEIFFQVKNPRSKTVAMDAVVNSIVQYAEDKTTEYKVAEMGEFKLLYIYAA